MLGTAVVLVIAYLGVLPQRGADPAAATSNDATLDVNDTSAIGTVGDSKLSIDEAIRLANGSLSLSRLSSAEPRSGSRHAPARGRQPSSKWRFHREA